MLVHCPFDSVHYSVAYTSPDVLILSETKIDCSVSTSEFLPVGYRGLRKDRNRSGGGVMVGVRDCFTASEVHMSDVDGEVQWVKSDLKNDTPLFVGAFYGAPSERSTKQLEELDKSLEHINQLTRNDPNATIIAGWVWVCGCVWVCGWVWVCGCGCGCGGLERCGHWFEYKHCP